MLAHKQSRGSRILVALKSAGSPPVILPLLVDDVPLGPAVGEQVRRYRMKSGLTREVFIARVLEKMGTNATRFAASLGALQIETAADFLDRVEEGILVPGADLLVAASIVAGLPLDMLEELQNRMSALERLAVETAP